MLKKISFLLPVLLISIFITSQESEESVEEVVTVGTKASIISAIDKQRESNLIVSVVDSDALGDFPDTTAAEAIRRLSGITVENDQGEGRYVSIRGLSGDLNAIAVNGAMVPAPEGGRKVMLDGLPTELLDSIEVYKSLTADKDADSIGGRIEFKTKKARSLDGTLFKVKLDTSYNDQSKNSDNPKLAMTYGKMINDNLGHIVGLTYASKQIISYNNETGFPGWTNDGAGKRLDDDWEMRYYDLTRERTGLTYDVDFIVDDQTSIFANFLYNHYQDDELRNKDEYGSLKHGEVFSNYSEINRIRRDAEVRRRIETRDIRTAVIGAETMFNGWFTEIQYSHSYAEEDDTNNIDVKFRSKRYDTDDCGGPCGYFYYSNPQKVGLSFDSSVAPIWDTSMTVDAWEEDWSLIKDTEQAIKIDMSKDDFDFMNVPTSIKFGFKHSQRTKERDRNAIEIETGPATDLAQSQFNPTQRYWPFAGQSMGPMADDSLLWPLKGTFGGPDYSNVSQDYESEEDITAAYIMGTMETDKAVIILGLRVEDTSYSTLGYNDGDINDPITGSKDYTFVSPSINVKYFVSDEIVIRGALWRALSRPGFGQASTVAQIQSENDGTFTGEMGNPDLDPYEANNFDLSVEKYGENNSFSLGYFKKDIDNAIYPLVTAGTINGIVFRELETYVNTGPSDVSGFELNVFQELDFLPEPFDGLFLSANITKTDGESTLNVDNGTITFPFRKLSDKNSNFSIGYDKGKFDIRLSAVSRTPYLDYLADEDAPGDVQGELSLDNIRYTDDHTQYDFNLKYKINDNFSIKFDISNITDEPEFYYWGTSDRLSQYDLYGTTYSVGIRYNL
jgi:TonB-dependent receptor